PSAPSISFLTHHGNVAVPACLSTLGRLGAELSVSTVQCGWPFPVLPQVQPAGNWPTVSESKFVVALKAGGTTASRLAENNSAFIIGSLKVEHWRSNGWPHRTQHWRFAGWLQGQINLMRGRVNGHRM